MIFRRNFHWGHGSSAARPNLLVVMATTILMTSHFAVSAAAFGSSRSSSFTRFGRISLGDGLPRNKSFLLSSNSNSESTTTTTTTNGETPVKPKRKSRRRRIKADERVIFFPTAARRSDDGTSWDIPIHGWIFEPETRDPARRAFVTSLRKYLKLERHSEQTKILKKRVGLFLVDNERRKELSVQIGCDANCGGADGHQDYCRIFPLPRSAKNGHFEAMLKLEDAELQAIADATSCTTDVIDPAAGLLQYRAVTEPNDDRVFEGVSHLIPTQGWSVISDIDDTVKITGVGNKKALLRSTFMEEFKEVQGMSQLYQKWANDLDAKFHFVSSSPWQLWEELETFLTKCGFPRATFHLKPIRIKDRSLFNLWKCPIETKTAVLESILENFPQRKFLLVGDSGEKDPEVYGDIARRYPDQVKGVFIRHVTEDQREDERYQLAFQDVPPEMWSLFEDPSNVELPFEIVDTDAEEKPAAKKAKTESALKP